MEELLNENKLRIIKDLMMEYDSSFYIYDEHVISQQIDILKEYFPQFEFLYSVKSNPFIPILTLIASKGLGFDAASADEVIMSHNAGVSYEQIFYSTPGKTRKDIEKTIDKAIIVADSYNELLLINDIAKQRNLHLGAGLRININFSMEEGKGSSSKFGVDEKTLIEHKDFLSGFSNVKIIGIHVHIRSQVLDFNKLNKYYEKILELALFCKVNLGLNMEFVNFGGGLGIVYSIANDAPLDIQQLSKECKRLIQRFKNDINARFIIETGRFVVCEAGLYVTRIADIKESMGTKYLIVEKGLNGFLRPSISELLMAYTPAQNDIRSSEPLFTARDAFEFIIPEGEKTTLEKVSIVGSLCTVTDIMAKDVILPKAHIGDIIIVTKAGSYSYSLSPILFASHPLPLQFYLKMNGKIYLE